MDIGKVIKIGDREPEPINIPIYKPEPQQEPTPVEPEREKIPEKVN